MPSVEVETGWSLWGVVSSPWFIISTGFVICSATAYYIRKLFSFWEASSLVLLASFLFALTIALVRPVGDYVLKDGIFSLRNFGDVIEMCVAYAVLVLASLGMIRLLYRIGGSPDGQANPDVRDTTGLAWRAELFLVFMCFCFMHIASVILGTLLKGLLSIF